MAKRFTDTSKWAKESFHDLSLKMKVVWMYLCDNCDHAGVWDINLGLISYQVGTKITLSEITDAFGDKIEVCGSKLLIHSFVEFQYGKLNPDNRVHQSVISRLEKVTHEKVLTSPLQGAKDKDKDKDKDKEKEKGGVGGFSKPSRAAIEDLYQKFYPLKEGKSKGIEIILREWSRQDTLDELETAVVRFFDHHKAKGTEKDFLPHFKTWAPTWRDWKDPAAGTCDIQVVNWDEEAAIVVKAIGQFPPGDQEIWDWIGPERAAIVKAIGGFTKIREVGRDAFSLKRLATLLQKTNQELQMKPKEGA